MDACSFSDKGNYYTSAVGIQARQKTYTSWSDYVEKAKLLRQKGFASLSQGLEGLYQCKQKYVYIYLGFRELGHKNRDLGNRASPASHVNTSKFYEGKSDEARSRKLSQPGWLGSYEEALLLSQKVTSLGLLAVLIVISDIERASKIFPWLIKIPTPLADKASMRTFGGIKVRSARACTSAHSALSQELPSHIFIDLHHLPTASHHANWNFGMPCAYHWNDGEFSYFLSFWDVKQRQYLKRLTFLQWIRRFKIPP